jgi:hypothetical protein
MGICSHRNAKRSREAKICEFEVIFLVDKQILRLEVAVQDSMRVTVQKAGIELMSEFLRCDSQSKCRIT